MRCAALRQFFRRYTGVTPTEYRASFKPVPSVGDQSRHMRLE